MKECQTLKLNAKIICAAALLCIAFLSSTALAQFDAATVLGTVRDPAGAVVPNVTVTLKNVETGATSTVQTDDEGSYQFPNVKIGTYQVTAEAQGFATAVAENVSATVNARQRVDLSLQTGAVTETVTITDTAQLLETDTSERGQVIVREQIINLPLNGRAYADLALLSPGVSNSILNNQGSGGRDASFNVNGLRSSLNNFILDGIDNNAYETSNQGFSNQVIQPSPDAVEEFKVQTNNYSAEFGRSGGAVINTSIRSGTNEFHGSAWNFLRNTALNATGFFKPVGGEKPVLIQNQFGFTFGGPIVRNRAFFFVDYEGFRRVTRELRFATLPTLEQRQGIFRNAQGQIIPVRNPLTGEVYANGIPEAQITPFARRVLADLPAPNLPGTASNFSSLPRSQFFNDKGDVKLDFNLGERVTTFVRGSMRKLSNFEAPTIPGLSGGDSNANVYATNQQLAGGFTFTVTPTSLLEFRLGISRTEAGKRPALIGASSILETYGITGLPADSEVSGGLNTQSISGFTTLGRQSSNPQYQNPFIVNPRVNYSFIAGRHSFKTGYEYQRINTEIEDFHPKYGQDSYSGQFSRPSSVASNSVYNLADFLLGARSEYQLTNTFIANYRQRMHFLYVQDDFKVNPRLTLNLGLRYEFATPQYERDNRLSNFDPETNTVIQATDGSLADRALVQPDKNNFAPRLGFAYSVTERTVIRGGYGISYVHFNRLGGENILSFNPPQVFNVAVSQQPSVTSNGVTTLLPPCVGNNFTGCFRTTQQGYPENLVVPERFNALRSRVNYIPFDSPTASIQSFHVSVQHEIARNLLVDVAYVGNRSNNLIVLADYNQARPNAAGENTPLQQRRPLPAFSFIQAAFPGGEAQYDALQIKLERRFTDGLYLLNSFTYSRALDNAAGHLESFGGDNSRANFFDLAGEWGRSSYDVPVINTTSFVFDVPFGRGRKFGTDIPRALDAVLGGLRLTLINQATSGRTVNLSYSPAGEFNVGAPITYRPNLTGDPVTPSGERTIDNFLNRDAVSIPTDRSEPFGNAPRNAARGPAFWQTDLGLHKQFRLFSEDTRLELRAEAFNVFNRTNFGTPAANISNSNFGQIRSTFPARQIQLAVKLYF
ncbi:MAG: TonB-dependent receptor [Pyrinomonadaceae bacterium]|nr:TonB-dependent receptor [Pyrinomonadaceae bacterium]